MPDTDTQYSLMGNAFIEAEVCSNYQLTHDELEVVFNHFINVTLYKTKIKKEHLAEYSNEFDNLKLPDDLEIGMGIVGDEVKFDTVESVYPTDREVLIEPEDRGSCPACGHVGGGN